MVVVGQIKKGAYFDSVTLMRCGREITRMKGIADAAVVMGTKSNRAILRSSGLLVTKFSEADDTDLLIAVKADTEQSAEAALAAVDGLLNQVAKRTGGAGESHPLSLEGALKVLPDANLALISLAGRYAGEEAMRALERGLHVMLFSDNVPLDMEIKLKRFARGKGLLVMGPGCGTAIINGVPLAFANVVRHGDIGIVAAAGTGLQEASCIISNAGAGISQAIGTGGRDVMREVGGIMFVEALKALANDEGTRVILLISKPPDKAVLNRITKVIRGVGKPVVSLFIGAEAQGRSPSTLEEAARNSDGEDAAATGPSTLEEAALTAVALSRGEDPEEVTRRLAARDARIQQTARREGAKRKKGQRYVRGLFSGGTLCAEAQVLFAHMISPVYSNVPVASAKPLKDSWVSRKNTVIDLGADEFTIGRLHPMIDYTLRNRRIVEEARDPETAVILLDVVLGYGANLDPASELSEVIRQASGKVTVVCSITGTDQDPQNRSEVEKRLKQGGSIAMPTNAAACKLAAYIIQCLESK